jgi:biotin carboxyl carrier protein
VVRRYVALLDGGSREETVEVEQVEPGLYEVRIGGAVHRVDAYEHDRETLSLIVDTASYSVALDRRGAKVNVRIRPNQQFALELLDERRLRMRRASGTFAAPGKKLVASPLPGKVVKVLVKVGDEVKEGQGLLVLEAMKMENEMKSPKGGKVTEVRVREGQAVEANAGLVAVE